MKKIYLFLCLTFPLLAITIPHQARGQGPGDESLFSSIQADALLVLDLSGSMRMVPAGNYMYLPDRTPCGDPCTSDKVSTVTNPPFYIESGPGRTKQVRIVSSSTGDTDSTPISTVPKWSDVTCSGPFYRVSKPGYTRNCRRVVVAKDAIFNLLDDNNNSSITVDDENSLCIKMGYMRFYQCQDDDHIDEGANYSSGCNTLERAMGSSYASINTKVQAEWAKGGTALAASLSEAKLYLDTLPTDGRKRFVILVTDGADSITCCAGYNQGFMNNKEGRDCGETLTIQFKKARNSVAMAKALKDAGYRVIVLGFGGDLPFILKNTLNWMAYYGGTDNPDVPNSGDPAGYNPDAVSNPCETVPEGQRECYLYKDLVQKPNPIYTPCTPFFNRTKPCTDEARANCTHSSQNCCTNEENCYCFARQNDPAKAPLSGYAFMAENATQLIEALKTSIAKYIKEEGKSYSFTAPTLPSLRLIDRDIAYLSSFIPKTNTPFWEGSLKAYQLETDGTLKVDGNGNPSNPPVWVASIPTNRTIKTYVGGALKDFTKDNIPKEDLDVSTGDERNYLVSYIRSLKLGDIFHSNPVIVGSPSQFYQDDGFNGFYNDYKNRTKLIIVGANDGMLHAFRADTGQEAWAFIPNSLLKKLKNLDPARSVQHDYYVDATPRVADVWIYSTEDDKTKSKDEWKTVLISGLRKGGKHYFALDITDTSSPPKYLWEFPKPGDSGTLLMLGQSWSEPAIGRVKVEHNGDLVERWVAFIPGGFDSTNTLGKGFYVIDIKTGNILKGFSGLQWMNYSIAAPPRAVDTDLDGFIDRVYVGDLGGQMWVFDVSFKEATKKSNSLWTGKRLFAAPIGGGEKHPIYTQAAVAFDGNRTPIVYFGTGDQENPRGIIPNPNWNERFYAVIDDGKDTYPRGEGDLSDVTLTNTFIPVSSKKGWYIRFTNSEKVLARPAVFNMLVYFTTFTPVTTVDPCSVASGSSKLYIVEYLSGGGATLVDELSDLKGSTSSRSIAIGNEAGAPSPPVISVDKVTAKTSVTVGTTTGRILSREAFSPAVNKELLYWRKVTH